MQNGKQYTPIYLFPKRSRSRFDVADVGAVAQAERLLGQNSSILRNVVV